MNIAVFTNILNPYRTSFFEKMNDECVRNGDDFRVYAMTGEKSDRPWRYEEFQREYTRLLNSKTIRVKGIFLHFNPSLKKELDEFRPDVVIMAGSYLQPTVIQLTRLKKKYGYTTFFWSESHFKEQRHYNRFLLSVREGIRRRILKRMDGFWYPGEKAKEFVDKYKSEKAILLQVPNTVEDSFFAAGNVHNKENHLEKVLITPARLHPAKGILEFIDLIKDLNCPNFKWLIAGDGELKNEIEDEIEKYKLNVMLLGNKSPGEVRELYSQADVFLLPSVSDPNPLTCVEALWSGLPLFVSEHVGNSSEVIVDGENGYIFSYRNRDDSRKAFVDLLNKPSDWYCRASKVSYELAVDSFQQDTVAVRTLKQTKCFREKGSINE